MGKNMWKAGRLSNSDMAVKKVNIDYWINSRKIYIFVLVKYLCKLEVPITVHGGVI